MKIKESVEMMMLVLMAERKGKPHPPHATITKDRKNGESQSHRGVFKQNTVEMTEEKKLRKILNKL